MDERDRRDPRREHAPDSNISISLDAPRILLLVHHHTPNLMVTGPRVGLALRRASIFQDGTAYLRALSRKLCASSPDWDQTGVRLHLHWLAAAAGLGPSFAGPLPRTQRRDLMRSFLKLRTGMPLAYVLGTVPFADLELSIRPPTLIPRPETEEWAVNLAHQLPSKKKVLDLCAGSGAIGLYLAHATGASVTLVDVSSTAIELATENAHRLPEPQQPKVVQADLFAPPTYLTSKVDLVVCNPPYVTPSEYANLDEGVRAWEDEGALLGVHPRPSLANEQGTEDDRRGLAFYRRIAELVPSFFEGSAPKVGDVLVPQLVLEIGHTQAADVVKILRSAPPPKTGLEGRVHVWQDMGGKNRVVVASWVQAT